MLDIYFLGTISREGQPGLGDDAVEEESLDLFSVEIFGSLVA